MSKAAFKDVKVAAKSAAKKKGAPASSGDPAGMIDGPGLTLESLDAAVATATEKVKKYRRRPDLGIEQMPMKSYMMVPRTSIATTIPNIRRQDAVALGSDPRMAELVESVKRQGILEPVILHPAAADHGKLALGRYELIAGFRRYTASCLAEMSDVPACVYCERLSDRQILEVQLSENLHRADLAPTEEADVYKRMSDALNCTHEEIALRVGKSAKHVGRYLKLLALPEEIRERIDGGEISLAKAQLLCSLPEGVAAHVTGDGDYMLRPNWTAAQFRTEILRRFMGDLSGDVPFDVKREYRSDDGEVFPPCTKCHKKNQTELFDDEEFTKGDRCSDSACFRSKADIAQDEEWDKEMAAGGEDACVRLTPEQVAQNHKLYLAGKAARRAWYIEKMIEKGFAARDYLWVLGGANWFKAQCSYDDRKYDEAAFNEVCLQHVGKSISVIQKKGTPEEFLKAMVLKKIFDDAPHDYSVPDLTKWIGCEECPEDVIEKAKAEVAIVSVGPESVNG